MPGSEARAARGCALCHPRNSLDYAASCPAGVCGNLVISGSTNLCGWRCTGRCDRLRYARAAPGRRRRACPPRGIPGIPAQSHPGERGCAAGNRPAGRDGEAGAAAAAAGSEEAGIPTTVTATASVVQPQSSELGLFDAAIDEVKEKERYNEQKREMISGEMQRLVSAQLRQWIGQNEAGDSVSEDEFSAILDRVMASVFHGPRHNDAPESSEHAPKRLWLFSTHATQSHWDAEFSPGDGLVFGKETAGAPQWLHDKVGTDNRIKIPQFGEDLRSLNLATSAGIGAYEALRQLKS